MAHYIAVTEKEIRKRKEIQNSGALKNAPACNYSHLAYKKALRFLSFHHCQQTFQQFKCDHN